MANVLETCAFVEKGYGQVEPNHLSAQRTGQIYAQLPVATSITALENGRFVKYDYANKEVNYTGAGEWMLVYNEVKVYRDYQGDKDFAMLADNYGALVYAAHNGVPTANTTGNVNWASAITAADPYEVDSTATPMQDKVFGGPALMHDGYTYTEVDIDGAEGNETAEGFVTGKRNAKTMVPRVFKTNIGDIFTTNTIINESVAVGNKLVVNDVAPTTGQKDLRGYLKVDNDATEGMIWQVVKVYTMPDGQPGAKIMRIA